MLLFSTGGSDCTQAADHVRDLQTKASQDEKAPWGHWGPHRDKYTTWKSHSNRLIPIYTFGINLKAVNGEHSPYRDAARIEQLYGRLPEVTLNKTAEYFDQTDVYRLQKMAAEAGKKRIILMVFDGTDWQTTWCAAIVQSGKVGYQEGRGTGLAFQDYRGVETDFGYFVTAPWDEGTKVDVSAQLIMSPGKYRGGYDYLRAGCTPWGCASDLMYPIGKSRAVPHAYTDSASSATSLTCGIKTYNDSINVDPQGKSVDSIARQLQAQGWAIGVVTSVPISHATPACAYANNVFRDDYQDLTRDLVGLPSISHRTQPLPGVDVLIGTGWGDQTLSESAVAEQSKSDRQGSNFVPGNKYLTDRDLHKIDVRNGGRYKIAQRESGVSGKKSLLAAASEAAKNKQRLLGFYGVAKTGHLPFQTADGKFDPTVSPPTKAGGEPVKGESYTQADVVENPVLADMTVAALTVLEQRKQPYWLMVEAGDVDWANHTNNIDNSIGAVRSGDQAFRAIAAWIEKHGGWKDTALLLTADHGHYFFLEEPAALLPAKK